MKVAEEMSPHRWRLVRVQATGNRAQYEVQVFGGHWWQRNRWRVYTTYSDYDNAYKAFTACTGDRQVIAEYKPLQDETSNS